MSQIPSEADVVVIGSGAAGMAAAVTAAEGGAKVVVFEKERSLGGTSNFFQGTFGVESDMQRAQYIDYTRDEAFKGIMDYSHWKANPRLVRVIVNESGATIGWLQERGVVFSEVTINMPDSPRTYHLVKGTGEALIKALVTHAKGKGVDIITSTPVTRLFKQGGSIGGVLVDDNGEEVQVSAKAVVVASGGYANNEEWIKKYSGFDLEKNLFPVGNVDKMGDGIRMSWEAGAAEEGIEVLELYRVAPVSPEFAMGCQLELAGAQPDLWVDMKGERFCDETVTFYDAPLGNASARYAKGGHTFCLFDDSIVKHMVEDGIEKGVAINLPGMKLTNLEKELQAAKETNSKDVCVADSIEELAQKMEVDPATLKATVDEYNGYCEKHHDDLFAKDPKYLRPLKGPKFYALKARTVFLGTMGGIRINEKTEVIDKKEAVIPGLYATGFDAGGMYGDSYCIKSSSGLASAFALNSGRIAGRNALKYIGKG